MNSNTDTEIELRDTPNYKAFEDSLNEAYIDTAWVVQRANIESFSFAHTDGDISNSEKAEIIDSIDAIIESANSDPVIIDVVLSDDRIDVVYDDGVVGSAPAFPDDIKADGGLNIHGQIITGHWCNDTEDALGGGAGRVGTAFISDYALSAVERFKDIGAINISGGCPNDVNDEFWIDFQEIFITDSNFFQRRSGCTPSSDFCLDSDDLDTYLWVAQYHMTNELPTGYKVIGYNYLKMTETFSPVRPYWNFHILIGKPDYESN